MTPAAIYLVGLTSGPNSTSVVIVVVIVVVVVVVVVVIVVIVNDGSSGRWRLAAADGRSRCSTRNFSYDSR